jgi:outer membrane protein TolC
MTELEIQARSEVRLAQERLRSLERALDAARRAADQTGEVLRITTTAFEVGATTNLEVIDAQRSDLDAKTTAEIAEGAVRRANSTCWWRWDDSNRSKGPRVQGPKVQG